MYLDVDLTVEYIMSRIDARVDGGQDRDSATIETVAALDPVLHDEMVGAPIWVNREATEKFIRDYYEKTK